MTETTPDVEWFTLAEAAELLRMPRSRLRVIAARREISHHRDGRWLRFDQGNLDEYKARTSIPAKNDGRSRAHRSRVTQTP